MMMINDVLRMKKMSLLNVGIVFPNLIPLPAHTLPQSACFCHLLAPLVHNGEQFVKESLLLIGCRRRWCRHVRAKHQYMN